MRNLNLCILFITIKKWFLYIFWHPWSYKAGSFTQIYWLIWREALSRARNPRETKIALIQSIVVSLILGLIYFKLDLDQNGVQNINGVLFILCVNSSFSSIFPVLNGLLPIVPLFLRENKSGMYTVFNFFLSRFLVDIPRFTLIPLVFASIVYWSAINSFISHLIAF